MAGSNNLPAIFLLINTEVIRLEVLKNPDKDTIV